MADANLVAPGLWLMFALGLRHGFDPDHIAMIDGMAYHSLAERPRLAPWSGTLFALGHGLTVRHKEFSVSPRLRYRSQPAWRRLLPCQHRRPPP